MDSNSAPAPPQQRQKQKPQKATEPMPQLGLHRVEPRPVAPHPPSPPRRPILWREAPKLWRDEKPPKKKKKKAGEDAAAISAKEMAGAKINQKELAHLLQFLMCQLRWQAGKIVDENFEAFDNEMRRIDTMSDDVASCSQLMAKFLDGPAAGDRWCPGTP